MTIDNVRDVLFGHGVYVYSVQEMASIYPDRVVAIRGPTVDSMSDAEAALSAKLRDCHQRDYISMTRVRTSVTILNVIYTGFYSPKSRIKIGLKFPPLLGSRSPFLDFCLSLRVFSLPCLYFYLALFLFAVFTFFSFLCSFFSVFLPPFLVAR